MDMRKRMQRIPHRKNIHMTFAREVCTQEMEEPRMATTHATIVGVFQNTAAATTAMHDLESAGFEADHIYSSSRSASDGSFISGVKSLFTGEDATTGTFSNDLVDLGLPQDEAHYYEHQYQAGRVIIAVRGNGREQEVTQIFQLNRAQTYETQATAAQAGSTSNDQATTADTEASGIDQTPTDEQRRLRLREEQLNVTKERVQAGEVGLHKEVITEQKHIDVPLSHEEVYVERRPVADGQIDNATPIGEDETIRVPVSAEQVHVDKDTVVTGEVAIGKRKVQETQQVSATVRREEARVDQQGDVPLHDGTDEHLRSNHTPNQDR
jgi:uncharacterized protein (TIGR02271 family)